MFSLCFFYIIFFIFHLSVETGQRIKTSIGERSIQITCKELRPDFIEIHWGRG